MSSPLEPVIGLEIHVQLATRTKMFCGCELEFGAPPNTHTCPVCLGLPGALPAANEEAVRLGVKVGLALGATIAERSIFHRKNYFYPDLPKGYQISQYDEPLCSGGELAGVRIHRVHLEDDAAKLTHVGESGRIHGADISAVDFNRGGTPLAEIVTEPDLRSAAQAREWLQALRVTLRQLGVSDVNMEEGSLRCDANVSLRLAGSTTLGTKTELKNMNSFRYLERGVDAEIARQTAILDAGGQIEQETLHFDPQSGAITSLRSKEEAHDYRYFPEPDLVPIPVTTALVDEVYEALPELPSARAARYALELGVPQELALRLAQRVELARFFEAALDSRGGAEPKDVALWTANALVACIGEGDPTDSNVAPAAFGELVSLVASGGLSRDAAEEVLAILIAEGGRPAAIVEREQLGALGGGGELRELVRSAIADNADAAEKVKAGKGGAVGPIVGAVMKETRGRADGGEVARLINEELGL